MTATTPSYTEGVTVAAIQALARGAVFSTTFDLRNKPGAWLTLLVGRTGATAIDSGIKLTVQATIQTSPIIEATGAPPWEATCDPVASVSGVCAASGNGAGAASLTLNAAKTFVAGTNGKIVLCVCDNTASPTSLTEFVEQALATSTTVKLLTRPTISGHNSTSHNVADKSNVFRIWLEGGAIYAIIFNYAMATTGDTAVIGAFAQTLDSLVTA